METPVTPGTNKGSLAKKLAKVLIEINRVPKSGWNDFHRYKFVTESDLSDAVREHLGNVGVFIFTNVEEIIRTEAEPTSRGGKQWLTKVKLSHTFVDGDTGAEHTVFSYGEGIDGADKGIYKAITGATKYFLYKNFLISTGDDPERLNDKERAEQEAAGKGAGGRQRNNPDGDGRSRSNANAGAGAGEQQQQSAPPADQKIGDKLPDGVKWRDVKIHFGKKYKGKALGELAPESLIAWVGEWAPKPEEATGKITDDNVILRTALNSAKIELDAFLKQNPTPADNARDDVKKEHEAALTKFISGK